MIDGEPREPAPHRRRRSAIARQQRAEDATLDRYCTAPWCGRRLLDTDEESTRGYCPECEAMVTELEMDE